MADFIHTLNENDLSVKKLPKSIQQKIITFNDLVKEKSDQHLLDYLDDEIDSDIEKYIDSKQDVDLLSPKELQNEKVLSKLFNEGHTKVSLKKLQDNGFITKGVNRKGGTFGDYKVVRSGLIAEYYKISKS